MALAYDGASPFDLNAAKQHGAILITGYIVGSPGGFDPINKARVGQIRALGMGFLPNWERGAAYLLSCGKAGGLTAGKEAVAALRVLGVPDDGTVACPFSWDTYITPSLYPQCGQVADGIIAGLGGRYRFSAYAQGGLLDWFHATGRMKVKGWLSGSSSFPGFNAAGANVGMVQSHNATGNWITTPVPGTDINTVTDPRALGAWWPPGSPYATGDDMADPSDVYTAKLVGAFGALLKHGGVLADLNTQTAQLEAWMNAEFTAIEAMLDPAKFASALAAKLPPGTAITTAQLEAALRALFGSLDNPGAPA